MEAREMASAAKVVVAMEEEGTVAGGAGAAAMVGQWVEAVAAMGSQLAPQEA